jgi:Protein of unknown function (DUF3307)
VSEAAKEILICLLAAHFLGDFILQSDADAAKKRNPRIVLKHAAVVAGISYLLCGVWTLWQIPLALFFTHGIADFIKANLKKESVRALIADQAVHLGIIGALVWMLAGAKAITVDGGATFWAGLAGKTFLEGLVLVSGLVASVKAGGILIGLGVKPFTNQLRVTGEGDSSVVTADARGFESGGKVIGYLERSLIFLFIMMEYPAGIGFLIAAKSILRFGEVKDRANRMQAEYIIIGTLMSYGYGILIAHLTSVALTRI